MAVHGVRVYGGRVRVVKFRLLDDQFISIS